MQAYGMCVCFCAADRVHLSFGATDDEAMPIASDAATVVIVKACNVSNLECVADESPFGSRQLFVSGGWRFWF